MEAFVLRFKPYGGLVRPALDDDGTGNFLAWPTREEAEIGLAFQRENYLPDDEMEVVPLSEVAGAQPCAPEPGN